MNEVLAYIVGVGGEVLLYSTSYFSLIFVSTNIYWQENISLRQVGQSLYNLLREYECVVCDSCISSLRTNQPELKDEYYNSEWCIK